MRAADNGSGTSPFETLGHDFDASVRASIVNKDQRAAWRAIREEFEKGADRLADSFLLIEHGYDEAESVPSAASASSRPSLPLSLS